MYTASALFLFIFLPLFVVASPGISPSRSRPETPVFSAYYAKNCEGSPLHRMRRDPRLDFQDDDNEGRYYDLIYSVKVEVLPAEKQIAFWEAHYHGNELIITNEPLIVTARRKKVPFCINVDGGAKIYEIQPYGTKWNGKHRRFRVQTMPNNPATAKDGEATSSPAMGGSSSRSEAQ